MFSHLQNAIHVTLCIIRGAFISSSSGKNVHKNLKCPRFKCPYCNNANNVVYVLEGKLPSHVPFE